MLSIQKSFSSIQSSDSDIKLNKKDKKKNLRSQSTELEFDSCSQSETNNDDEKKNEYINVINKKLRTLRKRMNKIEKYEQTDRSLLNNDQISSLEKKPEVNALIREFEDLIKQYTAIDERDQKKIKLEKKFQEEKIKEEINEKIEEQKKSHSSQLQFLFKTLYALNVVINTRQYSFTNDELNALNFVRSILMKSNEITDENQKMEGEIVLEKLINSSEEECCENINYAEVNKLIDLILNPPQVTEETKAQPLTFFSEEEEKNEYTQPTFIIDNNENDDYIHENINENEMENEAKINDISVSLANISFIPPSEVEENEEEEEQKEEVVQIIEPEIQQYQEEQNVYINENYNNNNEEFSTLAQEEIVEIKEVVNNEEPMVYPQFIDEQQYKYENQNLIPNESMNVQDQPSPQQPQQLQQPQQQPSIPMYQNNQQQPQQSQQQQQQQQQQYPRKRGGYYNNRGGRRRGNYQNGQRGNRRGGYSSYRGGSRGGYYQQQQQSNGGKNNYYKNAYQNQSQTHMNSQSQPQPQQQ